MTPTEWAGIAIATVTIIGSFVTAIRYLVKSYLSELKPDGNGGHNLEGRVRRLEGKIDQIYWILIKERNE